MTVWASPPGRETMPGSVKVVLGWLSVQAVVNALVGGFLLHAIHSDLDRGLPVDDLGFMRFASLLELGVAAVLVACVVLSARRYRWVRGVAMTIEAVGLAIDLVELPLGAGATTFISMILALIVLSVLASSPAKEWFNR